MQQFTMKRSWKHNNFSFCIVPRRVFELQLFRNVSRKAWDDSKLRDDAKKSSFVIKKNRNFQSSEWKFEDIFIWAAIVRNCKMSENI